jgi:hypothetical protein
MQAARRRASSRAALQDPAPAPHGPRAHLAGGVPLAADLGPARGPRRGHCPALRCRPAGRGAPARQALQMGCHAGARCCCCCRARGGLAQTPGLAGAPKLGCDRNLTGRVRGRDVSAPGLGGQAEDGSAVAGRVAPAGHHSALRRHGPLQALGGRRTAPRRPRRAAPRAGGPRAPVAGAPAGPRRRRRGPGAATLPRLPLAPGGVYSRAGGRAPAAGPGPAPTSLAAAVGGHHGAGRGVGERRVFQLPQLRGGVPAAGRHSMAVEVWWCTGRVGEEGARWGGARATGPQRSMNTEGRGRRRLAARSNVV